LRLLLRLGGAVAAGRCRRARAAGGIEEPARVGVLRVEREDVLGQVAHARPVAGGQRRFRLIEQPVDLSLDAFARQMPPPFGLLTLARTGS